MLRCQRSKILTNSETAVMRGVTWLTLTSPIHTPTAPAAKVRTPQSRRDIRRSSPIFLRASVPVLQPLPLAFVLQEGHEGVFPGQIILQLKIQNAKTHSLFQAPAQQASARRAHGRVGEGQLADLQSFGRSETAGCRPGRVGSQATRKAVIIWKEVGQTFQVALAYGLEGVDGHGVEGLSFMAIT